MALNWPTNPTFGQLYQFGGKTWIWNGLAWDVLDGGIEVLTANRTYYVRKNLGTCTITIASPGVVTKTAHGLLANDPVVFKTSGALPTGLVAGTVYFVKNPTTDTFEVAATAGGASINTSGSQSGTHTVATGNDSNTGLTQDRAGAWLTYQKAIDFIAANIDQAGFTITVQLDDSRYVVGTTGTLKNVRGFASPGTLIIKGNVTTPANVHLVVTGTCFSANGLFTAWDIRDMRLEATSALLNASNGSMIRFQNLELHTCSSQLVALGSALVKATGNYAITGAGSFAAINTSYGGLVDISFTVAAISSSLAFTRFVNVQSMGICEATSWSFTGGSGVTGARYFVQGNGFISTNGGGANFFPGDVAGTETDGGNYS